MNMENQVTSIEQSQRLLEMGIEADNASMQWERYAGVPEIEDRFKSAWHIVVDKDAHHADHYEYVPAFTVVDLFDIIGEPKGYTFYVTKWDACEEYAVELAGFKPVFFKNKRLVDSAFRMVEYLKVTGRLG